MRNCRQESCQAVSPAAAELAALRRLPAHQAEVHFPPACRSLVLSLAGNMRCADCDGPRPEWASVSYGILLCVQCGGRHRSYGVQSSRVKSIDMDAWSHDQILAMLEGGNDQLCRFFDRHQMTDTAMTCRRYKTKAALFYRTNLQKHVRDVGTQSKVYPGREAIRKAISRRTESSSSSSSSSALTRQSSMQTIHQQGIAAN
ncbi:with coiled-coil, ANK repeat and PH domain-containing protein [Seminavis robusta]|uniref:With coiled-coil, ANK repeat and PH domain-containing protein n=1 Tax=Seminavis robusta TaxID=568900 RepID=A0A9N8EVB4_9STRA|nr:with coiled-coil, ANK repeat and PH domain-containing protein [Seminavis robusta]|eukprot:Sro1795_g298070.1 with coiled-coil, ANK repeat and PH domain-containing protein (201) ;mRNA; f:18387-18989